MHSLKLHIALVIITLPFFLVCTDGLKTFYFSDFCPSSGTFSRNVYLGSTLRDYNSTAILKAKNYGTYPTDMVCTVSIIPPTGYSVVAAVRRVDLRSICKDSLQLINSNGISTSFCGFQYYSNEDSSFASSSQLTIIFKTGNSFPVSTLGYDGFQLTVTTYRDWPCAGYEYTCSNARCIAKELTCDGHNHCGDTSDEYHCGFRSVGGIVGTVFGCIFIVIAIIACVTCCRRRRRRLAGTVILNPVLQQPTVQPYGTMPPQPQGYYPPVSQVPPPPPPYATTAQNQEAYNPSFK